LDFEHQNVSIRRRHDSEHDQHLHNVSMLTNGHGNGNDIILFDPHNNQNPSELIQQQQQQRPSYNLRRAAAVDVVTENSNTTSLTNLSIFSRSNSLLPPFGGIELQRCLSNADIEQDVKIVHDGLIPLINKPLCINNNSEETTTTTTKTYIDVRIEEGRLWYQRAWF